MDIDFPLILVILVFGSGLIWLLDALFLAPGRRRVVAELQGQFPGWEQQGSGQALKYEEKVASSAREPRTSSTSARPSAPTQPATVGAQRANPAFDPVPVPPRQCP